MKIRVNVQGRRNQFGQGVSIAPSQILADTLILFRLELEGRGAHGAHHITIPPPTQVFRPTYGPGVHIQNTT